MAETALTLPVSNLSSSTHFYLAALQPLGYCFISQVEHETGHGSSAAVGLGPQGTTRVDLFLSQQRHGRKTSPHHRIPHVIFPASGRHIVRDFYAAAIRAGAKPIERPTDRQDGMFAATVADLDSNKIDVTFENAATISERSLGGEAPTALLPGSQPPGGSIQKWRESVAHSVPASSTRGESAVYEPSDARGRAQLTETTSNHGPARSKSRRSSGTSRRLSSPPAEGKGNNKVVGTIIGAAAGAALAYTMVRSKRDSSSKERDFASRMAARERLREEARQHAAKVDRGKDTRRGSHVDRDSGYYSENPPPPYRDKSPTILVHQSTTYPQSGERGRSGARRVLEYAPRTSSPASHSQSTVRPPRRSQSNRAPREGSYVTRRLASPTRYGPPPSLPPLPASFSRERSERSKGMDDHARSRHTIPSVKERPPSSYHQPTARPEGALPPRAASAHSSTRTVQHVPLQPAAVAPSAALTAKALSKRDSADPESSRGTLDELKTVVPDDSISCVTTPDERRDRRSKQGKSSFSDHHSRHSRGSHRTGLVAA